LAYFDTSLTYAKKVNDEIWQGINSGFIGQVLYIRKEPGKAKPLLEVAYAANKDNEKDHAAKALQWLARIDLDQGHLDSALIKCNLAVDILKGLGQTYYLQTSRFLELAYITAADIHRARGNTDSFYYYSRLFSSLHDSLQTVSLLSSSKVSQLRVDNENNYREIQMLHREKDIEKMKRNFLIVAIVLLSLVVLLYVKRLLLKQKHKEQMSSQEQKVAEAELKAARQQMKQFTENIIEKSELIDRLKLEISNRAISHEQHEVIEALSHQTILTEADWDNFKHLFEKVYPGFFMHIKEKAADITLAEQRMAALTRLNLTSRHMASMLGISVDSVHKTKQRLRQRLHITADENLEQSVAGI
jgi:DNA-binding CsgD family transcriptional regulator